MDMELYRKSQKPFRFVLPGERLEVGDEYSDLATRRWEPCKRSLGAVLREENFGFHRTTRPFKSHADYTEHTKRTNPENEIYEEVY